MNRFAKDMLMAKYKDGRGYSSSDNYRYSSRDYLIREEHHPDERFEHLERQRAEDKRDFERGNYYRNNRDYGDYGRNDYDDRRDRDYNSRRDYERRDDMRDRDYNRRDYNDYERRDYERRDYGEETRYGKMSKKDLEKWKHEIVNADGTRGEHYKKDQIEPVAKRMGIDVERMGGADVFCAVVNMTYADYCEVAKLMGVSSLDFYVHMAKAFLNDKDFKGEPEEKVWLYYKCIVESEE